MGTSIKRWRISLFIYCAFVCLFLSLPSVVEAQADRLVSQAAAVDLLKTRFRGNVYLIMGYSSTWGYEDMNAAHHAIDEMVARLQMKHGTDPFVFIYGGDSLESAVNPDEISFADLVKYLKDRHKANIVAFRTDEAESKEKTGAPEWVSNYMDFLLAVPTEFDTSGNVIYGGTDDKGEPTGPSRYYLGREMVSGDANKRLLKGVFAFGGGYISKMELVYATNHQIPVSVFPLAPRSKTKGPSPVNVWWKEISGSGCVNVLR